MFAISTATKQPRKNLPSMFLTARPTTKEINRFLEAQRDEKYSYTEIGATRDLPICPAPPGYTLDHNRVRLGKGHATFANATAALRDWSMFANDLTEIYPLRAPIEVGQTVAVVGHHFGFWSLNACRVIYTINETGDNASYGFAYGTLDEHIERGEERFTVEWHRSNDEVWYDLLAFSRPRHILARVGYPVSRMMQKRFASESKSAMLAATNIFSLAVR